MLAGTLIRVDYFIYSKIILFNKHDFLTSTLENSENLIFTVVGERPFSCKELNGLIDRLGKSYVNFIDNVMFVEVLTNNMLFYLSTRYNLITIEC